MKDNDGDADDDDDDDVDQHYHLLVKSNQWSIINAAFWLVELLLGYML